MPMIYLEKVVLKDNFILYGKSIPNDQGSFANGYIQHHLLVKKKWNSACISRI